MSRKFQRVELDISAPRNKCPRRQMLQLTGHCVLCVSRCVLGMHIKLCLVSHQSGHRYITIAVFSWKNIPKIRLRKTKTKGGGGCLFLPVAPLPLLYWTIKDASENRDKCVFVHNANSYMIITHFACGKGAFITSNLLYQFKKNHHRQNFEFPLAGVTISEVYTKHSKQRRKVPFFLKKNERLHQPKRGFALTGGLLIKLCWLSDGESKMNECRRRLTAA